MFSGHWHEQRIELRLPSAVTAPTVARGHLKRPWFKCVFRRS
jgi:hypothetical protein